MKSLAFAIQDSQVADNFAMDLGKLLPKVKEEQTGINGPMVCVNIRQGHISLYTISLDERRTAVKRNRGSVGSGGPKVACLRTCTPCEPLAVLN